MTATETTKQTTVLPLESGDRLTRAEFERRYRCRPDIKKAELIEGVVYVASPVRFLEHGEPHVFMLHWLSQYRLSRPGTRVGDNTTVRMDLDNEPQPDIVVFRDGGSTSIDDDGYLKGAPELVIEIAASSASYDLHDKMHVYRRNGVREYVVWQVLEGRIDWFRLRDGEYVPVSADARGVIQSEVFPGLRLAVKAMLAGDMVTVLKELSSSSASN